MSARRCSKEARGVEQPEKSRDSTSNTATIDAGCRVAGHRARSSPRYPLTEQRYRTMLSVLAWLRKGYTVRNDQV